MNTVDIKEIIGKIQQYCAYQDRCHQDVEKKLHSYHLEVETREYILTKMIEDGFLNEERFALSFARGKHRYKNWGRKRIEMELKMREVSSYLIKKALLEIEDEYMDHFEQYSKHVWDSQKENDVVKKRKKVGDALLRKGYESSMVYDFIYNQEE